MAADAVVAQGTVMHTLAVLADAFPADEQKKLLLARGAAVLFRADDTACAVASQTSAYCSPERGGKRGKERKRDRQIICVSSSLSFRRSRRTTFPSFPCD